MWTESGRGGAAEIDVAHQISKVPAHYKRPIVAELNGIPVLDGSGGMKFCLEVFIAMAVLLFNIEDHGIGDPLGH